MSTAPLITIFVRHSEDCKYKGDEFEKRCKCRKHLRWSQEGTQHRRKANTRDWLEAEKVKRQLEDQLAGRTPEPDTAGRLIQSCIEVFLQEKQVQGISANGQGKYTRELTRLQAYCESEGVFTVQGITRELLTGFCATWEAAYASTVTRSKVRERLRVFFRYCFEAQWLPRVPSLPKIQVDDVPTLPLSVEEFERLLVAIPGACPDTVTTRETTARRSYQRGSTVPHRAVRMRALVRLMRWSGLAVRDAVGLRRDQILRDDSRGLYRIVTNRQKTGTHVSVPIPDDVALEVLAAPVDCAPEYLFLRGTADVELSVKRWQTDFRNVFEAAGLLNTGFMISHRLRDTFAVDLLEKGVPLEEVSKLLGHESIKTTEKHYSKWMKGRQDRLDSLVVGTWATPGKRKAARK